MPVKEAPATGILEGQEAGVEELLLTVQPPPVPPPPPEVDRLPPQPAIAATHAETESRRRNRGSFTVLFPIVRTRGSGSPAGAYRLRLRAARTLATSAPAPPTRASTMVGSSGESSHPVCARSGKATVASIKARRRLERRIMRISLLSSSIISTNRGISTGKVHESNPRIH